MVCSNFKEKMQDDTISGAKQIAAKVCNGTMRLPSTFLMQNLLRNIWSCKPYSNQWPWIFLLTFMLRFWTMTVVLPVNVYLSAFMYVHKKINDALAQVSFMNRIYGFIPRLSYLKQMWIAIFINLNIFLIYNWVKVRSATKASFDDQHELI